MTTTVQEQRRNRLPVSVVVCCYDRELYANASRDWLYRNFDDVVEVASKHSIFEAYNRGRELAKHGVILYVHEDVILESDDSELDRWVRWFLENADVDLAGVIGCKKVERWPWWMNEGIGRVRQGYANAPAEFGAELVEGKPAPAESIDGLFMLTRIPFVWPEHSFVGWHGYDAVLGLSSRRTVVLPIRVHHVTRPKPRTVQENLLQCYETVESMTGIPFVREQWFKADPSLRKREPEAIS